MAAVDGKQSKVVGVQGGNIKHMNCNTQAQSSSGSTQKPVDQIPTGPIISPEEIALVKRRFDRKYPSNKPLTDAEASMIVTALKESRRWVPVVKEENHYR